MISVTKTKYNTIPTSQPLSTTNIVTSAGKGTCETRDAPSMARDWVDTTSKSQLPSIAFSNEGFSLFNITVPKKLYKSSIQTIKATMHKIRPGPNICLPCTYSLPRIQDPATNVRNPAPFAGAAMSDLKAGKNKTIRAINSSSKIVY